MTRMRRSALVLVLPALAILVPVGAGASAQAAKPVRGADMVVSSVSASPDPVLVNQSVTFTIGMGNLGPDAATEVQLTSALPAGVRFEPGLSDSA
jgi:uncharacterized repeat protein (TIGR01451 family)